MSTVGLNHEMWGITACFNPAGYQNRYTHLRRFSERVRRQGLKLLAIELVFEDQPFVLSDEIVDRVVQVRANTVLWQKERLLNLALESLPPTCDQVTWLDADLLFENESWVAETSILLDRYLVVQPFGWAYWMAQGCEDIPGEDNKDRILSTQKSAGHLRLSRPDVAVGHPGFAWAARRSLLARHSLYDRMILGGGDALIFWAMAGATEAWYVKKWLAEYCSPELIADYLEWARAIGADVQGKFSYTPGRVFHLWHGDNRNRQYTTRLHILRESAYDPRSDIALDGQHCWRWASEKPELHRKVSEYFRSRREDG